MSKLVQRAAWATGLLLAAQLATPNTAHAVEQQQRATPRVCALPQGYRLPRWSALPEQCRRASQLHVFQNEYAVAQLVIEAGEHELSDIEIETQAPWQIAVEHLVHVETRSNTADSEESLAFTAPSRPADDANSGDLPDALVPIPNAGPYFAKIGSRDRIVLYLEQYIPVGAPAGKKDASVKVYAQGKELATAEITIEVDDHVLPDRAASVFAYYERRTLERRFDDPDAVERQIQQTLHAHGVEAITQITSPADIERLRGALDGSWFTAAHGYQGPGAGLPMTIVPIGAYGTLGDPTAQKVENVRAIVHALPRADVDAFVYAIDEACHSPRGLGWRTLFDKASPPIKVAVGHTCADPPAEQDVDIVMMPASAFDPDLAREGRRKGKQVWIYNGKLPYAGPLMLDVPITSLTVNGWIASVFDVGRWFYWETIFWDDGNRGGLGPRDVIVNPETFHNADGDMALYDGLLLFPGRAHPQVVGTHFGFDGVFPSLRLKALRRGLEDAALIGLAAQVDPNATYELVRKIVPAALDEVGIADDTKLQLSPVEIDAARAGLRAIIRKGAREKLSLDRVAIDHALRAIRSKREAERDNDGRFRNPTATSKALVLLGLPAALLGFGLLISYGLSRRAKPA